ncbi:hypothetical protein AB0H07_38885 [Streptomyces sp. NPDC021354]|uniref:hypothetical protein n=1 Tax=Streptomyces sp. NPDC021354 TaxID=3154793 RepID=UPI0033F55955
MAARTEYDESQAAGRLRVPITRFRWAVHARLVPAPDVSSWKWSRAAVEAMDAEAIRACMPREPISGGQAADRIAEALGTPNAPGERKAVTAFAVRRLIDQGLLVELSANRDGTLVNPHQVEEVCAHPDLAGLVAAAAPLGPDQAADRLGIRRADWNHIVRLGWVKVSEWREVRFGTSRAGAVDVPLYRTADIDALPAQHPEIDWEQLRGVGKGQRSPLAALVKQSPAA